MNKDEAVAFPEDLSGLSHDELTSLEAQTVTTFDTIVNQDEITSSDLEQLTDLADKVDAVRAALTTARVSMTAKRDDLRERLAKSKLELPTAPDVKTDAPVAATVETVDGGTDADADVESDDEVEAEPEVKVKAKARPSLAVAQQNAPAVPVAAGSQLIITAAAPTSGISIGQAFTDLDQLTAAVQSYSRGMVTTSGTPAFLTVATVENSFDNIIDGERTSMREFEELARELRSPDKIDAIVAGGGWCAPSETRYNFFNISCEDGMIDLPTFGVKRGGVRFPVSPSLADVFTGSFTNATNPWLWTEADDILTVTGSTNKPCVRVPCATMDERRLECYGICLTAGNLTDNAWPEATRNYLKLLMSAMYHAKNARYITQMVALSSSINVVASGSGQAISADLPDYVALAARDYRDRYGLCEDDVLEVVLPRWIKDAIRSDLNRRTGVDLTSVSDADINRLFTVRNVRIQWVADWQVRTTGQPGGATALTAWPDTVDFMIYAAGTFMLGNGMSLDLGVVRDSVLNAENDHTAAWMEECHLIAKFGFESRQYRIPVCVAGRTGSANITDCHVL